MKTFHYLAVTIVADCPKCNLAVPIQTMEKTVSCPHCKTSILCDWEDKGRFRTQFLTQLDLALTHKKSASSDTVLNIGIETVDHTTCLYCESKLETPNTDVSMVVCTSCKAQSAVLKTPISGLDYALNVRNPKLDALNVGLQRIPCTSCGASLPLQNQQRTQKCSFCQNDNVIPDAIWHKIRPELVVKPFFVAFTNINQKVEEAQSTKDVAVLKELSQHFHVKVRVAVAQNDAINEEIGRLLMKDTNGSVLSAIKKHPKFSLWFEVKVFSDEKEAKQYMIDFPQETNPNLSEAEMLELAKQKMPRRLMALVYNSAITPAVMKQIIRQQIEDVWVVLAKRLDLDEDVLKLLVNCNHQTVNALIADNPLLPTLCINRLSTSSSVEVLKKLLKNTSLPEDIKVKVNNRINLLLS